MNKRHISFGDLKIGKTARQHINDCLDNNWITMGPKTELFEQEWGKLFNYPYNISTSSGTDALLVSLLSLYEYGAVKGKSEVILPALSFISTANAIRCAGFIPRWVDIKKETLNIDETQIEENINDNTICLLPVHTMGRPCKMDKICDIANKYNLTIIEDACESHSAKYKGQYIGTFGAMACFSFFTAHACVCGEQGIISCKNESLSHILRSIRNHGRSGPYFDFPRWGMNSKNTDLTSAIGLEGIEQFWNNFKIRYDNMKRLRNGLDKFSDIVWFSEEDEGNINCPHGFSITLKEAGKRNILTRVLDEADIEWKRNFGCTPQHGAFEGDNYQIGKFPNSEYVGNNGVHVGLHHYLSKDDVDYMIFNISKALEKC